jgi:uncharacterized protein
MIMKWLLIILALLLAPPRAPTQSRLPIIDMHLHAVAADRNGPPPLALCVPLLPYMPPLDTRESWEKVFLAALKNPVCADPIWSPTTDQAVMEQTIAVVERRNIIGVLSGTPELVRLWRQAAPGRFIPSVALRIGRDAISPGAMRRLFVSGSFAVLGEVGNQYVGIAPGDQRMAPYWALAEELDIPIAIHMGEGPPGAIGLSPRYRAGLTSPYLLEEVLVRHPRLRVSVMHYGSPLIDEMIAMLGTYPRLYVDLGGIQWFYTRAYFYAQLKKFIDAGFGKRVMFGSDQMNWPGIIEPAIAIVEEAPFLSTEQKRDIFYNNAARFLRLSEAEIAKHHRM